MTGIKCFLSVLVFTFVHSSARGDAEVSCVVMQSCILPCSFQGGRGLVLHWIKGTTTVHSYFYSQNQLEGQDPNFRNRTSLFKDQISGGNASLQLIGVKIQDEGRYTCYIGISRGYQESSVYLTVEAPVRQVHIQQVENRISCSSEGIYPEPELTWTTKPPSNITLQTKPTVHQTDQQLYDISSSLVVSDLDYSCTVSTHRNKRRTTWFKPASINISNTETTISCNSSNKTPTSLMWRFNHSQMILNQTRADVSYTVSEQWRQQVKSVSESGSLTLQDLSPAQEGTYTCELSDDEETYVTNTALKITADDSETPQTLQRIVVGVIVSVITVIIGGLVAFCICNHGNRCQRTSPQRGAANGADHLNPAETHEMVPLAGEGRNEGGPG